MSKVTIYPQSDCVVVENDDGDVRLMETYEFVIDLESIFDFLRLDVEVQEINDDRMI